MIITLVAVLPFSCRSPRRFQAGVRGHAGKSDVGYVSLAKLILHVRVPKRAVLLLSVTLRRK